MPNIFRAVNRETVTGALF